MLPKMEKGEQMSDENLKIAVICVGDELLKGFTVNTNLSDMGKTLLHNGFIIDTATVIPDDKKIIQTHLYSLLKNGVDIIIFSGGLGPTVDDLTKPAIAEALELKLIINEDVAKHLKEYWKKRNKKMPEKVMNQALIPSGADYFLNTAGTAPGLLIKPELIKSDLKISTKKRVPAIILLPGPPSELNPMFIKDVIPFLKSLSGFQKVYTKTIFVTGLPESNIEEKTLPLLNNSDFSIAYCASPAAVKVYLSGNNKKLLIKKTAEIRKALGKYALPEKITNSVHYLVNFCKKNNLTLSVAESCTGGLIAATITEIPGASEIFKGGIVSYSNEWKQKILDVPYMTIEKFGAVSKECAEKMVVNLCNKYNTDIGISVTGIAGPTGGSPEKPIGLVYIGIYYKQPEKKSIKEKNINSTLHTTTHKFNFKGNREQVRQRTLYAACNLIRQFIK